MSAINTFTDAAQNPPRCTLGQFRQACEQLIKDQTSVGGTPDLSVRECTGQVTISYRGITLSFSSTHPVDDRPPIMGAMAREIIKREWAPR